MMSVGIIGTGMLGNVVGLRLLNSGYHIFAYNRTRSKTSELEGAGAHVCDSPGQVAKKSNLVITLVRDADAVKQVSFAREGIVSGAHAGLVVADMSTINPIDSVQISKRFAESCVDMIDVPVMGGPNVAISGDLTMMAAGDKSVFERVKPVLDIIASKIFYLGEGGTAHAVKLAMNIQIAMLALSISEGITLARGAGIDPNMFLDILNSTYFKTGMSQNKALKMVQGKFPATFTLANLTKDLHTIVETSESFGTDLPMTKRAEQIYKDAVEAGLGELDYTGILEYIKHMSR